MEKRKIIKRSFDEYESLKPSVFKNDREEWERKGRVYGLRGLCNLIEGKTFELDISPDVQIDINRYIEEQGEKQRDYLLSKRRLEKRAESKTI